MKKIAILFCILFSCCLGVKAQVTMTIDEYNNLITKNTQLETKVGELEKQKTNLEGILRKKNDTIGKNNIQIADLQGKNTTLDQNKKDLEASVKTLGKEKIDLEAQLKKKNDTIGKNNSRIAELEGGLATIREKHETELNKQKEECEKNLDREKTQAKEQGKKDILQKIEKGYEEDFEKLIASSSPETVKRDLAIVESDKVKETLQNLDIYFLVKGFLTRPFNEESNNTCLSILQKLPSTRSVEKLKESIEAYSICVTEFKKYLEQVIELDKIRTEGRAEEMQKNKLNKISGVLSDYIVEYSASDYPYLSNIILEIMKRKQDNVDTSIQDLYDKFVKDNSLQK